MALLCYNQRDEHQECAIDLRRGYIEVMIMYLLCRKVRHLSANVSLVAIDRRLFHGDFSIALINTSAGPR